MTYSCTNEVSFKSLISQYQLLKNEKMKNNKKVSFVVVGYDFKCYDKNLFFLFAHFLVPTVTNIQSFKCREKKENYLQGGRMYLFLKSGNKQI
jgi:hypothetical protein